MGYVDKNTYKPEQPENDSEDFDCIEQDEDGFPYIKREKVGELPPLSWFFPSKNRNKNQLLSSSTAGISNKREPLTGNRQGQPANRGDLETEAWMKVYTALIVAFLAILFFLPLLLVSLPAFMLWRKTLCFKPRPFGAMGYSLVISLISTFAIWPTFYGITAAWFRLLGIVWVKLGNNPDITKRQLDFVFSLIPIPDFPVIQQFTETMP